MTKDSNAPHFEVVSRFADSGIELIPTRATAGSAGYDLVAAEDIIIPPWLNLSFKMALATYDDAPPMTLDEVKTFTKALKTKPTLVSTGVKAYMPQDTFLQLSVRSSCPLNYWLILANGVGVIDSDYILSDNEGEIFFQLINLSPFDIQIKKGDKIGQGIFMKYEVTADDKTEGERNGGFGSTSK